MGNMRGGGAREIGQARRGLGAQQGEWAGDGTMEEY